MIVRPPYEGWRAARHAAHYFCANRTAGRSTPGGTKEHKKTMTSTRLQISRVQPRRITTLSAERIADICAFKLTAENGALSSKGALHIKRLKGYMASTPL